MNLESRLTHATPAVSVIIPTHNRASLLGEALNSVIGQTFKGWEVVVVDDGSDPAIDLDFLRNTFGPRVRGIRHPTSRGGAAAKNSGIEAASAPVVAFLDDDDLYTPTYLEKALGVLDSLLQVDVLFMGVSWFGKAGQWAEGAYSRAMETSLRTAKGRRAGNNLIIFGEDLFSAMLRSVPMAFQRPVVRREALRVIGGYHNDCLLWDCDWAIRAAIYGKTALLEERLYRQRLDGQNLSTRPNIELDHHLSNIEIKERLLRSLEQQVELVLAEEMRAAAARAWLSLAYYYSIKGNPREAVTAWRTGQRFQALRKRHVDFAKLIVRAFVNQRTGPRQSSRI